MQYVVMNEYMAKRNQTKIIIFAKQNIYGHNIIAALSKTVLCNNPFDEDAISFPMVYDVSSMLGAYRGKPAAPRGNSPGEIPPVKCRHLADRSCTSGAAWWTSYKLKLHKFVRLII